MNRVSSQANDSPAETKLLSDGFKRHTLADGRVFEENGPLFVLTYQSFIPDSAYSRDIAIFGLNPDDKCLFDAWCYESNALRTYAFSKVIKLTVMSTGEVLTGDELRETMKGEVRAAR